jgi:hypothetical protein
MDKTSQVLKSLEKMAEKEFVPLLRIMSECLKNEILDYLEYVRNSGVYKSETIETELEFTPNVKDANRR